MGRLVCLSKKIFNRTEGLTTKIFFYIRLKGFHNLKSGFQNLFKMILKLNVLVRYVAYMFSQMVGVDYKGNFHVR